MPEPVDRKDPIRSGEMRQASTSNHPDREEAARERAERDRRDREKMGRQSAASRERKLAEDVTERRDREARENAELAENRNQESS